MTMRLTFISISTNTRNKRNGSNDPAASQRKTPNRHSAGFGVFLCILPCPVHRTLSVLSCPAQKALTPELCQPAALAFFFVPEPDLFPDFDLCCESSLIFGVNCLRHNAMRSSLKREREQSQGSAREAGCGLCSRPQGGRNK